ncbi:MAG: RAMP superfamily CRISPR-associated protein [Candidatus Hermodarchaeota archaeon]
MSNKRSTIKKSQLILIVSVYAHVVKTLNGSAPQSSHSYFLLLQPITYSYQGYEGRGETRRPVTKYDSSRVYAIKGLKGAIRHASMQVAYKCGIEMCHTSDKLEDKKKRPLIPDGFHSLGSCQTNGDECLMHQVYGSKGNRSLVSVKVLPITQIDEATANIPIQVQNVFIKNENRVCLSFEKASIQDFSETYFSGEFTFELNVTKLNPLQLGFILQSLAHFEQLGRGETAGYGRVEILDIELVERSTTKEIIQNNGKFRFENIITEQKLTEPVKEAWEAFNVFIKNGSRNTHTDNN